MLNTIKRITMSVLPLDQNPIPADQLYGNVFLSMNDLGKKIDKYIFTEALAELHEEQALIFFSGRKDKPVVATQHGFYKYGTD